MKNINDLTKIILKKDSSGMYFLHREDNGKTVRGNDFHMVSVTPIIISRGKIIEYNSEGYKIPEEVNALFLREYSKEDESKTMVEGIYCTLKDEE